MNLKKEFQPKSELEKFGKKVFDLLVENFIETYFVGGMVRDIILKRKIEDIDVATAAKPNEVESILSRNKIKFDSNFKIFGVIIAMKGNLRIEISTFRKDVYEGDRYPKVSFVNNAKDDYKRRDFTMNSLYFKPEKSLLLDYCSGLVDIENKIIRFIGKPDNRILEDPLRIVRAYRFEQTLNFHLEKKSQDAILKNISLLENISKSRIDSELNKIKNVSQRKKVLEKLHKKS